ncbi:hypothetical protein Rsub_00485 [Raphidocelis subcapitata]|uniref:Uncharacterized protein n=1 Tax=Raphidocelis subcapitata TaxID=307507 RepID=A0A2V0NKD4_9CHLO|nr:hypothetical protein Rsub_00485 [Raphidocelis subcapitata]|eukprot:GBF87774.1 hypothetical protein Rsub_00485 [Raphidocelis subcapitata]
MGKNTAHRAMQAQRYTTPGDDAATGGTERAPPPPTTHQEADVTYHTAEWHAARIAALQTTRMTWDEFRKQQREVQAKEDALVGSDKAVREHRALLDAERAARLGLRAPAAGGGSSDKKRKSKSKDKSKDKSKRKKSSKDKKSKKSKRSKDKDKKKKRKRSRSSGSSGSDSDSSGSDSDSSGSSGGDSDGGRATKAAKTGDGGPIKLSEYLRG